MEVGDTFQATRTEYFAKTKPLPSRRLFTVMRITKTGIVRATAFKARLRRGQPVMVLPDIVASFKQNPDGGLHCINAVKKGVIPTQWIFNRWRTY